MEQGEGSRKGRHLTREERVVIERMSRGGSPHGTSRQYWGGIAARLRENCCVGGLSTGTASGVRIRFTALIEVRMCTI